MPSRQARLPAPAPCLLPPHPPRAHLLKLLLALATRSHIQLRFVIALSSSRSVQAAVKDIMDKRAKASAAEGGAGGEKQAEAATA